MPLMLPVPENLRLPDIELQALTASVIDLLPDSAGNWNQRARTLLQEQLENWCACSPFVLEHAQRSSETLAAALSWPLDEARFPNARPAAVIAAMVTTHLEQGFSEEQLMAAMRRYRQVEMVRLVISELSGLVPIAEILRATTELADACIAGAVRFAQAVLERRFGEPVAEDGTRQELVVLAMGKLGGFELNFSSDVDLICTYRAAGETNGEAVGKRSIDNEGFFRRVTQAMARILGKITEDGFVFRVDLRLRPFGDSGPLVMNFDGFEHYYLTQGREWERYAMIKSRAICGLEHDRQELQALLKPFVYRRYLDYGAFESLRDLKQRIATKVRQKGMEENIKLGPGGIREIEFIGQAFQLVRGGREPTLQQRPILDVLDALGELSLITPADLENLCVAYNLLRRTENCLQMMRDQQVHSLPDDDDDRARLRLALGYDNWRDFYTELSSRRSAVQQIFQQVFQSEEEEATGAVDPLSSLWLSVGENPELAVELATHGFKQPEQVATALQEFVDSVFYRNLTSQAVQRVEVLMPKILQAVQHRSGSWRALQGLLQLVRSVAGRSVYLQVLIETPDALQLITRLFSRSTFVTDFVCQHPIVIDELLDYRNIEAPPDRARMEREMQFVMQRVRSEELDVQMDALRQFRQASTMRVAAAELEQHLDLMRVSDHLSWIAEITLDAVLELVWAEMVQRYGHPQCQNSGLTRVAGFAIVAYGKLGGLELGYASDLDLVFLHESEGTDLGTNGKKPIENAVFFARLAQKIVHFISTLTPAGTLYEIDTRLRPNGRSGMLVSSLSAFETYHRQDAWTWEHQALVRARVVVGNARIRRRFTAIRAEILRRPRDRNELRGEVAQMREKMRSELGTRGDRFDLKQDLGGIADIEFMVQYMVLWNASVYQELTLDTDNYRILERIEQLGFIPPETAGELRDAYLDFRRIVHRFALLDRKAELSLQDTAPNISPHGPEQNEGGNLGAASSGSVDAELLQRVPEHRERVTRCWRQLMEVDAQS
ncbi:MAG: bifunctional [glutamate--ammonia ligase]-adenylyl-L-tyrosine phosphorylase/[glutamate--ammonia-ligase] adenylyltransferase [Gammaproteobacteria bacterium]|nr:bifunctional [glutamate--ammonia ligase]-adenylyl-L-tyrosine phosphorylase/[glutamate--ammonia-ligase] adenylyltransferase [Gammaproteobacteria bacterium]